MNNTGKVTIDDIHEREYDLVDDNLVDKLSKHGELVKVGDRWFPKFGTTDNIVTGHYNRLPDLSSKLSYDDFANLLTTKAIVATERRFCTSGSGDVFYSFYIFYTYEGEGFCVMRSRTVEKELHAEFYQVELPEVS
jgi:hypothetical protein